MSTWNVLGRELEVEAEVSVAESSVDKKECHILSAKPLTLIGSGV